MDKTLGQIAHEAAVEAGILRGCSWETSFIQPQWESVAAAVASAVKEEDARICDDLMDQEDPLDPEVSYTACYCAAAIRASIKEVK